MAFQSFPKKQILWYLIILGLILGGAYFIQDKEVVEDAPVAEIPVHPLPFTISEQEITEENFSGNVAVVSGDSLVAVAAQAYINDMLDAFKIQADQEVPEMRSKFGENSPPATYTTDITASRVEGGETESAVVSVYTYTGGAHGSSTYKVFTARKADGKILSLADIIQNDKQGAFTSFVKNKLLKWRAGEDVPVLFAEDVNDLEFESFSEWALDDKNLILYFSQYEIGPGALGSVAFPLPLVELQDFLIKI